MEFEIANRPQNQIASWPPQPQPQSQCKWLDIKSIFKIFGTMYLSLFSTLLSERLLFYCDKVPGEPFALAHRIISNSDCKRAPSVYHHFLCDRLLKFLWCALFCSTSAHMTARQLQPPVTSEHIFEACISFHFKFEFGFGFGFLFGFAGTLDSQDWRFFRFPECHSATWMPSFVSLSVTVPHCIMHAFFRFPWCRSATVPIYRKSFFNCLFIVCCEAGDASEQRLRFLDSQCVRSFCSGFIHTHWKRADFVAKCSSDVHRFLGHMAVWASGSSRAMFSLTSQGSQIYRI